MTVGFEMDHYMVREEELQLEVCVTLLGALERSVDLSLFSSDGTAQSPNDYAQLMAMVFEPADEQRKCVNISINDDVRVESSETFTLHLSSTDSAVTIDHSYTTIEIIDNDQVMLSLDQISYTVLEDAGEVLVSILLTGRLERDIEVLLNSTDGSASSPDDYSSLSEILTLTAGSTTGSNVSLAFGISDDQLVEDRESFTVGAFSMDPSVNFQSGRQSATVYIVDNDSKLATQFLL